jgi:hypothetical protein
VNSADGVGSNAKASSSNGPPVPLVVGAPERSRAIGVGSNTENPVTDVRGAEGSRWKTIPLEIEPDLGQIPDHLPPHLSVMKSKDG